MFWKSLSVSVCKEETFKRYRYLSLDPNITGVFTGRYPFGIDPVIRQIIVEMTLQYPFLLFVLIVWLKSNIFLTSAVDFTIVYFKNVNLLGYFLFSELFFFLQNVTNMTRSCRESAHKMMEKQHIKELFLPSVACHKYQPTGKLAPLHLAFPPFKTRRDLMDIWLFSKTGRK